MPRAGIAVFLGLEARPAGGSQVEMPRVGSTPAPSPFVRRTEDTGKRSKKGGWRTMATTSFKREADEGLPFPERIVAMNSAPPGFGPETDLPPGFLPFLMPLHEALTPRQAALVAERERVLAEAHAGSLPDYLPPSPATTAD